MSQIELEFRLESILQVVSAQENFSKDKILDLSKKLTRDLQLGKRLAFIGNGGSAAEAMHLAAEFTGKCVIDHAPLPVMCLNESQSALTAISNDFGPEYVFSRQVEAHLGSGDYLIALSTSGSSKNILKAIEVALKKEIRVYLWTGNNERDIHGLNVWNVNTNSTPRIQEVHLMWGHLIAELVELGLQEVIK